MSSSSKGISYLLLAAFLYSLMPVLIRTIGGGGIPPISQVFLRYIFACMAACIYFVLTRGKLKIAKKDLLLLGVTTIFGYTSVNLFFALGILNTQVSNTLFLFYTFAIIAPILGFIFLKDKINRFNFVALILSAVALLLLFQPNSLPTWKIGGLFAILSSLGQATYLLLRPKLKDYPANFMMLANTFVGVILVGILSVILEGDFYLNNTISNLTSTTWLITIISGFNNFFAWFAMTKGFEYFKSSVSGVILLSELIFGIILALIFFNEVPTMSTLIGGLLVFLASILVILKGI